MKIDRITFTGADDATKHEDLALLSQECPRIEWGILLSKSSEGVQRRFPGPAWVNELIWHLDELPMLSGHLCGVWVRDIVAGKFTWAQRNPILLSLFHRLQLNFHHEPLVGLTPFYDLIKAIPKPVIFQYNKENANLFDSALIPPNAIPLFDASSGAGIVPAYWPKPIDEFTGYSGGLGPDNLADELKKIEQVVGEDIIWIDMESKVRDSSDNFSLDLCRRCYDIARPYLIEGGLMGAFENE